ncbi:MAG: hypothetical protein IPO28_14980 [Holophagaceae bacterium]|nr:hypothetical protein [Holophagaceae bacterium]
MSHQNSWSSTKMKTTHLRIVTQSVSSGLGSVMAFREARKVSTGSSARVIFTDWLWRSRASVALGTTVLGMALGSSAGKGGTAPWTHLLPVSVLA